MNTSLGRSKNRSQSAFLRLPGRWSVQASRLAAHPSPDSPAGAKKRAHKPEVCVPNNPGHARRARLSLPGASGSPLLLPRRARPAAGGLPCALGKSPGRIEVANWQKRIGGADIEVIWITRQTCSRNAVKRRPRGTLVVT